MKKTKNKSFKQFLIDSQFVRWCMLIFAALVFTLIINPELLVSQTDYYPGDVAERDIKAPRDFYIEDQQATTKNRAFAVGRVLKVYDYNTNLLPTIRTSINQAFQEVRKIVEAKEKKPPESEPVPSNEKRPAKSAKKPLTVHERLWLKKPVFEKKLGISVSEGAYKILVRENFSPRISELITRILTQILSNGVVANKEILLKESEDGIVLRNISTKEEKVVHNLKQFYSLDQAKTMVRVVGQPILKDLNYNLLNLIVEFSQRLLRPNITLNTSETEERKKLAASQIKPILHQIKAGEMLLREGEIVTSAQLKKLKALNAITKKEHALIRSLGAIVLLLCLIILISFIYFDSLKKVARNNKHFFFILIVLLTFCFVPKFSAVLFESLKDIPFNISTNSMIYGIPIASSAMIVCLFKGFNVALPFSIIISTCSAIILQNRLDMFIYFLLNSAMAAYWIQHCHERKVFVKAGVRLGLLNIVLATVLDVYMADYSGFKLLWDWLFAFGGGILAGIITAGLTPLVELAFGFTTDITLLELANLERPILRRLMLEAPGTYHHSVIVGSMVEAAASEIGANPLLAKVCGYYHDIGKIKKPLYFIENQSNGKNRHDRLAPSMSALILISHVKEGVEIAKKHKLGEDIIDAIRQHHGTSLIKYFHDKAVQIKGEDAVNIGDYRYPGPKPQTRETGLVLLADVVEAASRTLENPTPTPIQGHVQKLINKIFADGQLDNCELTLKDLNNIAKSFNKILNGIHHHRIEYAADSKSPEYKEKKQKNGNINQQPAKPNTDTQKKNKDDDGEHLKRLGVS